jgi:lipoprotein signal peptidase
MSNVRLATTTTAAAGAGQRLRVLVLLALVILLDQTTKRWAWQHVDGSIINRGSDQLAGPRIGDWYADSSTGALLDLAGLALLITAYVVLVRRRRPAIVLVSAALAIGGWASNQLDRVGLHSWTAPGSVRGAVDFIAVSHYRYNLADIVIAVATLVLSASLGYRSGTAIYRRLRTHRGMPVQPRTVTGSMSRGAASRNATGLLR